MIRITNFLKNKLQFFYYILVIILSFLISNIATHFFFRFLFTTPLSTITGSVVIILIFAPMINVILKWLIFQLNQLSKNHLNTIYITISLLLSITLYISSPVKITGNLLLLARSNNFLYNISRFTNIISFIITSTFIFLLMLLIIHNRANKYPRWVPIIMGFFILYFIMGLLIYSDYGISSDVLIERHTGLISAQYITTPTNDRFTKEFGVLEELSIYQDRYYGVAYQMPLAIMEFNAMIRNQYIWEFRQLMNFITFFIGVFAFFNLVTDLFNDPCFGLLGAFFLVSMPRVFAHAFFNPKDAVFLAVFTIALFFTIRFWKKSTPSNSILAGVFCAYATNVRIIAISLVLITIGLLIVHYFKNFQKFYWQSIIIFMSSFLFFLFLFWPASWENPIRMLLDTIFLFSDFSRWDGEILYMGEFIRGDNLPWHYLPVWMSLTIPPTLIVLFLYGAVIIIKDSLKLRWRIFDQHKQLVQLSSLCLVLFPVLLAVGLGSILYNGWRHFYFIFAPFLLVVLAGIKSLLNVLCSRKNINFSVIFSAILLIATGINSIGITLWNINNHPYQYAYFNGISNIVGRENFERDYWRISMKQGLDYLFQYDQNERFYVCTEPGGKFNALLFPYEESNRIRFINEDMQLSKCDYSITTYRYEHEFACPYHLYSIKVDNVPILSIFECEQ